MNKNNEALLSRLMLAKAHIEIAIRLVKAEINAIDAISQAAHCIQLALQARQDIRNA